MEEEKDKPYIFSPLELLSNSSTFIFNRSFIFLLLSLLSHSLIMYAFVMFMLSVIHFIMSE